MIGRPDAILTKPGAKVREETPRVLITTIEREDQFALLRDEWNDLARGAHVTIYQTHEWLSLWWKHFGADNARSLHIVVVRYSGEIVGILPLFIETRYWLGLRIHKSMRLIGCAVRNPSSRRAFSEVSPTDFLDFIALPQHRTLIADAFLRHCERRPHLADEILLENVSDESVVMKELVPRLRNAGIRHTVRQSDVCPRLNGIVSADDYLARLRPSVRRRLTHARTIFSGHDGYALESITSAGALPGALNDIAELHQRRWNNLGYPGLFMHQRFRAFHDDVAAAFLANGWLWFQAVKWHSVRIAARMGFKFHGRMYDYVSGFDECALWAKHRPGMALLLSMVEDAAAHGYQSVELLRGKEGYKFDLTSDYVCNWSVGFSSGATRNRFRRLIYGSLRLLDRTLTRLSTEWMLLQIQKRTHGISSCVTRYFRFRMRRLKEKLIEAEGGGEQS